MLGKTRSLCLAVLATAFVAYQPAYAQAVIGGDWRADVDTFAGRLVEMGGAPGIGLAIVQDDWVLHASGFGSPTWIPAGGRHGNGVLHRLDHQGDHGDGSDRTRRPGAHRA